MLFALVPLRHVAATTDELPEPAIEPETLSWVQPSCDGEERNDGGLRGRVHAGGAVNRDRKRCGSRPIAHRLRHHHGRGSSQRRETKLPSATTRWSPRYAVAHAEIVAAMHSPSSGLAALRNDRQSWADSNARWISTISRSCRGDEPGTWGTESICGGFPSACSKPPRRCRSRAALGRIAVLAPRRSRYRGSIRSS